MLKLKIKEKNDGYLMSYKKNKTSTLEHMMGIAKLYKEIKENQPDVTDEEIHDVVVKLLEKMEEED